MQKKSTKIIKTIRDILLIAIGDIGSVVSFMATIINYSIFKTSWLNPNQRFPATKCHIYLSHFCISLLLFILFAFMLIIPYLDRKIKPSLLKHSTFALYGAIGTCICAKICFFWGRILMQRIENGEITLENSKNVYLYCGISAFVVLSLFICIFLLVTYSYASIANIHPESKCR